VTPADVPPLNEALKRFERWYLIEVMRVARTITGAARIAGMRRQNFYRALRIRGVIG
jgi:DNA-binding phage protein